MKSLKTSDRRRALALCGSIVATWKQQIENTRGSDEIVAEAKNWRSMLHDAKSAQEKAFIEECSFPEGANDLETARELGSTTDDAERFHGIAIEETVFPFYLELTVGQSGTIAVRDGDRT